MSLPIHLLMLLCLLTPAMPDDAKKDKDEDKGPWSKGTFAGLKARSVGPALMSGRIGDLAINPQNPAHYYAAVCSGGVWATRNNGTTWKPIFDQESTFAMGDVAVARSNPNVVWVGSGDGGARRERSGV